MTSKFLITPILGTALILAACAETSTASAASDKTSTLWAEAPKADVTYTVETVADGLDHPWSLAFLPDGDMLVTERTGKLKRLKTDGSITTVMDFNTLDEFPVHHTTRSQAGLFDVVLHPDFEANNLVYISYAAKVGDGKNTLILMRYTLGEDGLSNGERLFTASPARKQSNHYGARIIFLPDGTLMMPHGEAFHFREKAQDLDNHFGKIIRLNADGSVPKDNPFVNTDGALPEIWSYGHRNPQGIILGQDGHVYSNEHGPKGGDEINRIEGGKNYGWPVITYGVDYSGARISPFQARDGMEQPLAHFVPSIAPSGFAQYAGDAFPDWQGDLFISALAKKHVRHVEMNGDGTLGAQTELFGELGERFRDVRVGPDGLLYLLTEDKSGADSRVLRISPK